MREHRFDGVLDIDRQRTNAGDERTHDVEVGITEEPDHHVELVDGVEQDPAPERGLCGVALAVVDVGTPVWQPAPEPHARRADATGDAAVHLVDELHQRFVEAQVVAHHHALARVDEGVDRFDQQREWLLHEDPGAGRQRGLGLGAVHRRRAGDHDRVVAVVPRLVADHLHARGRGDVRGAVTIRVRDRHVGARGDEVGRVASAYRAGADHEDTRHGVRKTGFTGSPTRWPARSSVVASTANASSNPASAWSTSSSEWRAQMNIDPLNRQPCWASVCCTKLFTTNSLSPGKPTTARCGSPPTVTRSPTPCFAMRSSIPPSMRSPRVSISRRTRPSATVSSTARAAASERASPPCVPEKNTSSNTCMTLQLPATAAIGIPLPRALP